MCGIALGCGVMMLGGAMATGADVVLHHVPMPHFLWDTIAYGFHGFGAMPVLSHGDKLWKNVMEVRSDE